MGSRDWHAYRGLTRINADQEQKTYHRLALITLIRKSKTLPRINTDLRDQEKKIG